ncbi:MAG: hypothetical protein Kow0069_01740 [Promethearchaeota archaeon]
MVGETGADERRGTVRVLVIQPGIAATPQEAYQRVRRLALEKRGERPDLAILPERWLPFLAGEDPAKNLEAEGGQTLEFVKNLAEELGCWVVSGGIWERREGADKPFVTAYACDDKGRVVGRQDKIHPYAHERGVFESGKELVVFRSEKVAFAVLICFDLTFWETPRLAVESGADLVLSPTMIREEGMHNWRVYLQARALENRVPVVGCNVLGRWMGRRFTGESMVVQFRRQARLSPSRLSCTRLEKNAVDARVVTVDVAFARKIRGSRLGEVVDKSSIRVVTAD